MLSTCYHFQCSSYINNNFFAHVPKIFTRLTLAIFAQDPLVSQTRILFILIRVLSQEIKILNLLNFGLVC
jgi:hypothetical protein